jgi:DNA-binding FrmR family transcriptional regulator
VKDVLAKVVIVWNEEHKIAEHVDEEVLTHMLVWEHCGVASDILLCTMMGNLISESISSRLPKPIKLEFENIFHTALYMMKKRYACIKIDAKSKKPIMNKKKIYSKGIMLARRDQCAWAKETFENTLWDDLLRKDIRVLSVEVAEKMLAPLRWQYPLQSFAVTQKLGYDYANETYPLKLFAEHLEDIGKPARANDRVQYVVTKAPHLSGDVKLGQKFRLIETLRDEMARNTNSIDHMYYVDRLKNDMDQILSIGYMNQIAKYSEERRTKRMASIKNRIDSLREQIDELQEENDYLSHQTDKKTKKERSDKVRKNKGEITSLKKSLDECLKILSKMEAGDNKSEVPKKLKGMYKGIIKLHLDEDIFKHQLRLIQHYSDSVVSEIKALNAPIDTRPDGFAKLWLVENDLPKLIVKEAIVNVQEEPKTDNQKKVTDFFAMKE